MFVVSDNFDIKVYLSEISESCNSNAIKAMRSKSKRADSQMTFDYINKNSATNGHLDDINKVIDKMCKIMVSLNEHQWHNPMIFF